MQDMTVGVQMCIVGDGKILGHPSCIRLDDVLVVC